MRPSRNPATVRTKDMGSGRLGGTEMLVEELQRALPRLGCSRFVLLQTDRPDDRIVTRKRMPRVVAMEGVPRPRRLQLRFELIDLFDLEEAVVDCEMTHQRCLDLRGVHVFERRKSVP